jgi:sugar lactone lactonase YvrE
MAQTVAPVLVPYTVNAIAGNNQSAVPGYGGEGVPGLNATMNGPNAVAVDSVGNVYIVDQTNAIIREWNAQTGIIKTIAGQIPTKCTGTTCTTVNPGCSDGVPALGNQVGAKMLGLVVDGYGNVYFSDYNYQAVWVIYRGGAQPANFINLVDPTGVATAGGVKPGYIYHVAGIATPKAGGGCTSTSGLVDKVLATSGSFHDPQQMGIDAAGNLYVQDYANDVVRVINTQSTPQTFFGVTVQPGFVAAVVGCNSKLTTACPTSNPPFGGPAGAALYSSVLSAMTTDQYGNVYELDGKGANGGIYAGAAYAGGAPLANLIYTESGLTATQGGWYEVINSLTSNNAPGDAIQAVPANGSNNIVLRPVSIAVDPYGNLYMMDYHWTVIYRVDANSGMTTRMNVPFTGNPSGAPGGVSGTAAAPVYCSGTSGPQAIDAYGDGCGIQNAKVSSGGTGYVTFDGVGNLYFSDTGDNIVRKASVGTQFPATAVGGTVSQIIQLHFDGSNLPITTGTAPNFGTTSFSIVPGPGVTTPSTEFTVTNATCSSYTIGTTATTVGTTTTYASSGVPLDNSLECYVTVTFTPTTSGTRGASLQATTASGKVYPFALSGIGNGSRIVVDGGTPTALSLAGLGSATSVATDFAGNTYVADPTNNQVVLLPAGGGAKTTIGTGLSAPQGVAVDSGGNVYISDSGNNRIVKVAAVTGRQTVLTTIVKNPNGLGVDSMGNVYVADTGNSRVVEIPVFGELGAAPLLGYSGAPALVTPVGIAVDKAGNVYVADSGNSNGLLKFTAGEGDLQAALGSTSIAPSASLISFGSASIKSPSGVAIDGAGNLYVSDAASNAVLELPSATGPGSEPFTLNFPGLSGPTGLALDASGNLYVADTGNQRVVEDNRTNLSLNFGNVYLHQTPGTIPLTVTNIGTTPYTPTSPFVAISGTNASDYTETDTCSASNFPLGTLASGLHCSLTPIFTPSTTGPRVASASVQGGAANISLAGTGFLPQAVITLAAAAPGGLVANQTATITLTATQPAASNIPAGGQVAFSYTVNGVLTTLAPVTLPASGIVTFNLPTLLPGRQYAINASYSGDAFDSAATASAISFYVPGIPVTVTAASLTYAYGGTVPQPKCTVSGILPADQSTVTYSCTTTATPSTPVGSYPITVKFSGGNYQNYGFPTVYNSDGVTPAIVTETKTPLTIAVANTTAAYGAPPLTFTFTPTGLVNGEQAIVTYTPSQSQTLPVGTYTVVPSVTIKGGSIGNYNLTLQNGTLTITQGPSALSVSQAATAILPTALASGTVTITAAPPQTGYYGTPTGTITLQDVFTPLTATGNGTTVTEPKTVLTLAGGMASYTPTDPTLGVHVYTFSYSGDSNFLPSDTTASPSTLTVDVADFTIVSTSTPIQVAPGVTPGGVATAAGEQAATPEIANVYIAPVLGSTETVNLNCAVPATYITCTLTPSTLTLAGKTTLVSVVSVSTPATLPVNFTAEVRQKGSGIAFAFVSLGLLSLLPLCTKRGRLQVSRLLLLLIGVAVLINVTGCGGNIVKFFTPVPAGPTQVTVTGTSGSVSRSFVIPIDIQ